MRFYATVALLVGLTAVAVVVVQLSGRGGSGTPRTGSVTMVGDSLNIGLEPYLERELPGWRIESDDVVGRGTDDGVAALHAFGHALAPVVVVSLGTNDPQTDTEGFRADVRRVLALAGEDRCVVWATVWRGGANDAFNHVLAEETIVNRALRLVEWDDMVAEHPEWLTGDGVHATPAGYEARARAVADVARDCLPEKSA